MVIEVEEHCRTLRRRHQEVLEFAEDVPTNGMHFVVGRQPSIGVLSPENIEVIEPEIGHHFLKLAWAVDRANHLLGLEFLQDLLRRVESLFLINALNASP